MDLITRSGREGLPVADRIGMLRADLLHEPFLGISSETSASSQTVHDLKLTIGRIRGTIELYEMAKKRGTSDERLEKRADQMMSDTECLVLAWRRGGHPEYERVRREQRALETPDLHR